jgi:hypothetical protein
VIPTLIVGKEIPHYVPETPSDDPSKPSAGSSMNFWRARWVGLLSFFLSFFLLLLLPSVILLPFLM